MHSFLHFVTCISTRLPLVVELRIENYVNSDYNSFKKNMYPIKVSVSLILLHNLFSLKNSSKLIKTVLNTCITYLCVYPILTVVNLLNAIMPLANK